MHLAIGKQLEKYIEIKDIERFRLGQILPDAIIPNQGVPFNSHYRKSVCNNTKMIMDFAVYYHDYENNILLITSKRNLLIKSVPLIWNLS